jgi:hypothetical protein
MRTPPAPKCDCDRDWPAECARDGRTRSHRAHVAEDPDGIDARGRLRHEQQVPSALAGLEGGPEAVDYFRHGEDEYLVTTSCGTRDLRREVRTHGPYHDELRDGLRQAGTAEAGDTAADGAEQPGPRSWHAPAHRMLRVLDEIHRRRVVVGDLEPGNVIGHTVGVCVRTAREPTAAYCPPQPDRNHLDGYHGAAGTAPAAAGGYRPDGNREHGRSHRPGPGHGRRGRRRHRARTRHIPREPSAKAHPIEQSGHIRKPVPATVIPEAPCQYGNQHG